MLRNLRYRASRDRAGLERDLVELRGADRETERAQRRFGFASLAAAAVAIGLLIAAGSGNNAFLLGLAAAAAVAFVVCLVLWLRHRAVNLEDRRYMLVEGLLQLIGKDLAKDAPLAVAIDFNRSDRRECYAGAGKAGRWNVKLYRDPWLELSGRLAEGTRFTLRQTEVVQHRSRTARSRSGKTKYKRKTKTAFAAELHLRVKPERYSRLDELRADAAGAVQLPPGVELKKLRGGPGTLTLKVACKREWDARPPGQPGSGVNAVDCAAMMFLSLYQVLNLSRAIDKAEARGGTSS